MRTQDEEESQYFEDKEDYEETIRDFYFSRPDTEKWRDFNDDMHGHKTTRERKSARPYRPWRVEQ